MRVVVGVTGGIAAYKAAHVVRFFSERGHSVRVVPTEASLNFVGKATWEALSGQPVSTTVFDDVESVAHVNIGQTADLVVVAPATADFLAKAAHGRADDLLTATLLVASCPVVLAPAMHTEMWLNAATQDNVATLRARGVHVLDPAVGRLTGKDTGPGRLPEPQEIGEFALSCVNYKRDLAGVQVLISLGGTQEPLDPVRFLGNRSSGLQGAKLAEAALARGADVTLVVGAVSVPLPADAKIVSALSAERMHEAMVEESAHSDVVIMAAAVADFRPAQVSDSKIKKIDGADPEPIYLVRNPDILADLAARHRRPGQTLVGFAAETGDDTGSVLDHGRAKALKKGADLLVVNEVGVAKGFGVDTNEVHILDRDGRVRASAEGDKLLVSHSIFDEIVALRS